MDKSWFLIATKDELAGKPEGSAFERLGRSLEVLPAAPGEPPQVLVDGEAWPHVMEDGESIWISFAEEPEPFHPYWPRFEAGSSYPYVEFRSLVQCELGAELENFIDCTHTSFANGGVFGLQSPAGREVEIQGTERGLVMLTKGENPASPLLRKWFRVEDLDLRQSDEIMFPHTARTDYRLGRKHAVVTSVSTPTGEGRVRVVTRVYLSWPLLAKPALWYLMRKSRGTVDQDKVILEDRSRSFERYGRRFAFRIGKQEGARTLVSAWGRLQESAAGAHPSF